jgi:hypothetical protein
MWAIYNQDNFLIKMNSRNTIVICFLLLSSAWASAQSCPIEVKTEVKRPSNGLDNGSIAFEVEGQSGSKDYSIYPITELAKDASKIKSAYKYDNLKEGIYEFVVIDKKKAKCVKEVQIKIEQE